MGCRGKVGGAVVSGEAEQDYDCGRCSEAAPPYSCAGAGESGHGYAVEDCGDGEDEYNGEPPHTEQIVEVEMWLGYETCGGGAVACCRKQHDKEGYEKQREYQAVDKRAAAHAGCKGFVAGYVVDEVHGGQCAGKEEYGDSEKQATPVGYGFESVGRRPL